MTARKQTAAADPLPVEDAQKPPADADEMQASADLGSQWEFLGRIPTGEDVKALLESVPDVWGVHMADFIDYVQALPQSKKYKRPAVTPGGKNVLIDEFVDAYTLYVSVGGRQSMLRAAQEAHGWRVDYRPEPITPSGVPGYLSFSGRLVYRVYVDIYAPLLEGNAADPFVLLGTRSGTAWVPEKDGKNAAGSNPYEKVETSALGRALGGWGFGVLPGSGIATVEEIAALAGNRRGVADEQREEGRQGNGGGRASRDDMLEQTLSTIEKYRQEAGKSEEEMNEQVAKFLVNKLGLRDVFDPASQLFNWSALKDGQLVMLKNAMEEGIRRLIDAQQGL